jgi:hypothetical protein
MTVLKTIDDLIEFLNNEISDLTAIRAQHMLENSASYHAYSGQIYATIKAIAKVKELKSDMEKKEWLDTKQLISHQDFLNERSQKYDLEILTETKNDNT